MAHFRSASWCFSSAMHVCCCCTREHRCLMQLWFCSSSLGISRLPWLRRDSTANRADEVFINQPPPPMDYIIPHGSSLVLLSDGGRFPFTRFQLLDASTRCHSRDAPNIPFCWLSPTILITLLSDEFHGQRMGMMSQSGALALDEVWVLLVEGPGWS